MRSAPPRQRQEGEEEEGCRVTAGVLRSELLVLQGRLR